MDGHKLRMMIGVSHSMHCPAVQRHLTPCTLRIVPIILTSKIRYFHKSTCSRRQVLSRDIYFTPKANQGLSFQLANKSRYTFSPKEMTPNTYTRFSGRYQRYGRGERVTSYAWFAILLGTGAYFIPKFG